MPLEDAAKKYTKQVHLRLNTAHLQPEDLDGSSDSSPRIPANARCCCASCGPMAQSVFVDTNERFSVTPSLELEQAANPQFGEKTYYAKVDTTPPERAPRRWERKSGNGGEE